MTFQDGSIEDNSGSEHSEEDEQDEYEEDEEDNTVGILQFPGKKFSNNSIYFQDGSIDDMTDNEEDIDNERGEEQEEIEGESKKKVDDDEDRSNPQYIPKKGTFYEHDDRTAEDIDAAEEAENPELVSNTETPAKDNNKVLQLSNQKAPSAKVTKKAKDITDRWSHDRFNENEQAPKSRAELVSAYGYDIRNEDCPPRPRRHRRYG